MCEIFRIFSKDWEHLVDYSEESMLEMYNHDTYGHSISDKNGFLLGKKWLSVNIEMWREDLEKGYLFKSELYNDGKYPHWWLDSIFKNWKVKC